MLVGKLKGPTPPAVPLNVTVGSIAAPATFERSSLCRLNLKLIPPFKVCAPSMNVKLSMYWRVRTPRALYEKFVLGVAWFINPKGRFGSGNGVVKLKKNLL